MSSRPSRRAALTGGAGLLLAACTRPPRRTPVPRVDPDVALRLAGVAREQALLDAYDRLLPVVSGRPVVAARLAGLRADHVVHLAALQEPAAAGGRTPGPPAGRGTPSPPDGSPATAAPPDGSPPTPSPPPPRPTVAGLRALERRTAAEHSRDALTASRGLAALLASVSACELSHLVLL